MSETVRVELSGKYDGWWAEMDGDPCLDDLIALDSPKPVELCAALSRLITSWNFRDKAGNETASDEVSLRKVGVFALAMLIREYVRSWRELPNQRIGS